MPTPSWMNDVDDPAPHEPIRDLLQGLVELSRVVAEHEGVDLAPGI